MATVATVVPNEAFIIQINQDYNICFDTISVTVAGALAAGTVLKDAATASLAADTVVLGILAEAKPAGTAFCRVMTRGNPTLIDSTKLSVTSATLQAALEAKGMVYAK